MPSTANHRNAIAVGRGATHSSLFIQAHVADAQAIQRFYGIPASVVLAQSALESGWGMHVKDNAWFGVKGRAPDGGSTQFVTHEYVNGQARQISDSFRAYADYRDAAKDYAQVLQRHFPAAYAHRADGMRFAEGLRGYATSPTYVRMLQQIITQHNLTQYDAQP